MTIVPEAGPPTATVAVSDPLARRFVARLSDLRARRDEADGVSDARPGPVGTRRRSPEQGRATPPLPIDLAVAAVQVASAFQARPAALEALRNGTSVVVVELPEKDVLEKAEFVVRTIVFDHTVEIVDLSSAEWDTPLGRGTGGSAAVLRYDGAKGIRDVDRERAGVALALAVPVCALTADAVTGIPESLRSTAAHSLRAARWSASLLSIVVESVSGTAIEVRDEPWIAHVRLEDLRISVSAARGADGSLAMLRTLVEKRARTADPLPLLGDLRGFGAARSIAASIVEDLAAFREGRIGWKEVERGLLLVGPPGTGKSFLANVIARSAGVPIVAASLAQWQSAKGGYLGDCLGAMRQSFQEARVLAPALLFIDELDSVGDRATFDPRHRDYSSQVLNGLLEQLDGAASREGVFVVGATNLLHRIDPAVVRSGRFDRIVHIELPEPIELAEILRTCLGSDLPDADLLSVALAGRGGAGADAAAWVRRARGSARRAARDLLVEDLLGAVREGREDCPDEIRRRIAAHEAGHACAVAALQLGSVEGISIHDAGGTTVVRAAATATTWRDGMASMIHLLAGRAAEIVLLGEPSAGSGGPVTSDLARATRTALAIEASWGVGSLGPLWLHDPRADDGHATPHALAPVVMRLLRHAETEAERLVRANHRHVEALAEHLRKAGYLDAQVVRDLLSDVSVFEIPPLSDVSMQDAPIQASA